MVHFEAIVSHFIPIVASCLNKGSSPPRHLFPPAHNVRLSSEIAQLGALESVFSAEMLWLCLVATLQMTAQGSRLAPDEGSEKERCYFYIISLYLFCFVVQHLELTFVTNIYFAVVVVVVVARQPQNHKP